MKSVDIFWTGGLDSTYRVLELLLVENKLVQPHYVIDTTRSSTRHELQAIETIKGRLVARPDFQPHLLLPFIFYFVSDIGPNETITRWYENIHRDIHIGIQYEWLSRLTEEKRLTGIELCIVKHPPGLTSDLQQMMLPHLDGSGPDCRLVDIAHSDLRLFQHFRFPIIHFTKLELVNLARQKGYADLLESVWFCHNPSTEDMPCGLCVPCQWAKKSRLDINLRFESERLQNRLRLTATRWLKNAYHLLRSS